MHDTSAAARTKIAGNGVYEDGEKLLSRRILAWLPNIIVVGLIALYVVQLTNVA